MFRFHIEISALYCYWITWRYFLHVHLTFTWSIYHGGVIGQVYIWSSNKNVKARWEETLHFSIKQKLVIGEITPIYFVTSIVFCGKCCGNDWWIETIFITCSLFCIKQQTRQTGKGWDFFARCSKNTIGISYCENFVTYMYNKHWFISNCSLLQVYEVIF